jgi:hypothetical protein
LAALTFSVSIGVAAAALRGKDSKNFAATDPLWTSLKKTPKVHTEERDEYIKHCLELLPNLIEDGAYRFVHVLSDVETAGGRPRLNKELGGSLKRISEKFQQIATYQEKSDLNANFHDLLASIFGYWPKYALGYVVDNDDGRPHIRFDSDELGALLLEPKQARFLKIEHQRLGKPLAKLLDHGVRKEPGEPIDRKRLQLAFIADIERKSVCMISPFVLSYVKPRDSASRGNGAVRGGIQHDFFFLDPLWHQSADHLCWHRFADRDSIAHNQSKRTAMMPVATQIEPVAGEDWNAVLRDLLRYPVELKLEPHQVEETFDFLEHELKRVDFVTKSGDLWRVDPGEPGEPAIFYRTGASAYVQVCKFDRTTGEQDKSQVGGPKKAIAKVLEPLGRGIYKFEEQRFEPEKCFVKDRSGQLGSGIAGFIAEGTTTAREDSGIVSQYAGQKFYLREYERRNLANMMEDAEREKQKLAALPMGPGAELQLARRILRSLYVLERATATLATIYKATETEITRGGTRGMAKRDKVHFIHRDIRPQVLLYFGAGIIKVCDFSAAYFPDQSEPVEFFDEEVRQDQQDLVFLDSYGMSVYYCAPEVYERPNVYSKTADVFSLGIILNELLFGKKDNVQRRILKWRRKHEKSAGGAGQVSRANWKDELYTEPQDAEVLESLLKKVNAFAATNPDEWTREFDLKRLVGRATCLHDGGDAGSEWRRFEMHEFRDEIADMGHLLRSYIANICGEKIDRSLEAGEPVQLAEALKMAGTVFGKTSIDSQPSAMVRCTVCYKRPRDERSSENGPYYDTTDVYFCEVPESRKKLGAAAQVLSEVSRTICSSAARRTGNLLDATAEELTHLSRSDARRALESIRGALAICSGIVDRVPDAIDGFVDRSKIETHRNFHVAGEALFDHASLSGVQITSDPSPSPPDDVIRQKAREIALLLVRAAMSESGRAKA